VSVGVVCADSDVIHDVGAPNTRHRAKFQPAETSVKNVLGLRTQGGSVEKIDRDDSGVP
jgi:hypothetical protein